MVGLSYVLFLLAFDLNCKPTISIRIGGLFSDHHSFEQASEVFQESHDPIAFSAKRNEDLETDRRVRLAFEFSIDMLNKYANSFVPNKTFTHNILSYKANSPLQTFDQAKQACDQLNMGVAAIVGFQHSSYIQSVCFAKQMPYIYMRSFSTPSRQPFHLSNAVTYSFQMSPTSRTIGRAVADIVLYYRWTTLAVVFCDYPGSSQVEDLIQFLVVNPQLKITLLRISLEGENFINVLKTIKRRQIRNVVLDCSPHHMLFRILKKALEMDLLGSTFNYILVGLDSSLLLGGNNYIFGHCNITTLGIIQKTANPQNINSEWNSFLTRRFGQERVSRYATYFTSIPLTKFTTGAALVYDGLQMYGRALASVYYTKAFRHRSLLCTDDKSWDFGNVMAQSMGETKIVGVTGPIKFDRWGSRVGVQLDVLSITYKGLIKVGKWEDVKEGTLTQRLKMFEPMVVDNTENSSTLINKTFVVTTIVESPYIFRHNTTSDESIYSGYCIDLLQLLAEDVGFSYKLVEVSDGEYGSMRVDGSWDGLIGELRSGYADMAVAPLTITYDREKATCFTKPYMSLGVGILYRKPSLGNPNLFGFLNPLSLQIWFLVFVSYLMVSFLMYFIARLSPYEPTQPHDSCDTNEETNFTIMNSLWYGAGALMQQGSDFNPRSMSTRLLAAIWWFFSLIFISSYTANLAAFLTVTRMEVEITSADDLAAQTKIKYGTLKGGSTATFFRNSKIRTYSQMWQYLNSTNNVFVKNNHEGVERVQQGGYAYLMESTTMEYTISQDCNLTQVGGLLDARGYGVATMDPSLRDKLSVAILKLQEKGILDELKHKWWNHNATQCPMDDKSSTQSLTIANLGGAFVFLAIGALVAITVAVIEYAVHSRIRSRTTQMKNIEDANGSVQMMDAARNFQPEQLPHSSRENTKPTTKYFSRYSKVFHSTNRDTRRSPKKSGDVEHRVPSCNDRVHVTQKTDSSPMTETVLSDNEESGKAKEQLVQKGLEKLKYLPRCKLEVNTEAFESLNRTSPDETYLKRNSNNYCNTEMSNCSLPYVKSYENKRLQHRPGNQQFGACSASTCSLPVTGNHLSTKICGYKQTNM